MKREPQGIPTMNVEGEKVKVLSIMQWILTNDGKAGLSIEGMSMEQVVFVCEKIKADVVSGAIQMQPVK